MRLFRSVLVATLCFTNSVVGIAVDRHQQTLQQQQQQAQTPIRSITTSTPVISRTTVAPTTSPPTTPSPSRAPALSYDDLYNGFEPAPIEDISDPIQEEAYNAPQEEEPPKPLANVPLEEFKLFPSWRYSPTREGFERERAESLRIGQIYPGYHFESGDINNQEVVKAHFADWVRANGRVYEVGQLDAKFRNFWVSWKRVSAHNAEFPEDRRTVGIFADLSFEEFKNRYLLKHKKNPNKIGSGQPPVLKTRNFQQTLVETGAEKAKSKDKGSRFRALKAAGLLELEHTSLHSAQYGSAPSSFDWENKGVLSPIAAQGNCGSCWAFAAVAAVEAGWSINGYGGHYTGDYSKPYLVDFPSRGSEQQVLDCTWWGDCDGGDSDYALSYIKGEGLCPRTGYLATSDASAGYMNQVKGSKYPYTAEEHTCQEDKACGTRMHIWDYDDCDEILDGNVWLGGNPSNEDILKMCVTINPVVGHMFVTDGFQDLGTHSSPYSASLANCGDGDTNHAILIVGYNVAFGTKFWNIRNSWGTGWGNLGYGRIKRGSNTCSVEEYGAIPLFGGQSWTKTYTGVKPPVTPKPPTKAPVCPTKTPLCYPNHCPGWKPPAGCPSPDNY